MVAIFNLLSFIVPLLSLNFAICQRTYFVEDDCLNGTLKIPLKSSGYDSSTVLSSSKNGHSSPNHKCNIVVIPEAGYGTVIIFEYVEISKDELCRSYLQVCGSNEDEDCKRKKFCKMKDKLSESFNGGVIFHYMTSEFLDAKHNSGFQLTLTSYRPALHKNCGTSKENFLCENHHCIWKGLRCDGRDNCGDESDEINCPANWHLIARIILAVFSSIVLILLSIFCSIYYFNRRSRKHQVSYKYVTI